MHLSPVYLEKELTKAAAIGLTLSALILWLSSYSSPTPTAKIVVLMSG
ncbi:hypothetical protein GLIP_3602 [Aliiglaciecola lipolytica E3]|uniref:Uncharacterized protein n=1 Tax=Aliiglaciecola lipolytica E3 TaxID=1127673 RepID=K6YHW6_9ALTE|nr:hypothetical protein GLIP_3602 [Aliiglaciecola lipolytica E3]